LEGEGRGGYFYLKIDENACPGMSKDQSVWALPDTILFNSGQVLQNNSSFSEGMIIFRMRHRY